MTAIYAIAIEATRSETIEGYSVLEALSPQLGIGS
jgi:hypothetical protein